MVCPRSNPSDSLRLMHCNGASSYRSFHGKSGKMVTRGFRLFIHFSLFSLVISTVLLFVAIFLAKLPPPILPLENGYHRHPAGSPRVFSHRGSTKLFPQNTLFAMVNSLNLGADVLDMDARLTKDGQVVLVHDSSAIETTGVDKFIHESTLDELKLLDFAYAFTADPERQNFPFRGLGISVLTLEEALRNVPNNTLLNIELKIPGPGFIGAGGALPEKVCVLLRLWKAERRVIVMSFSDMAWFKFRRVCPEVPTAPGPLLMIPSLLLSVVPGLLPNIPFLLPYSAIQPPALVTTKSFVDAARSSGRPVHVWTVDDPWQIAAMMDIGVDGIMSDTLDVLLEKVGRNRARGTMTPELWLTIETGGACRSSVPSMFASMVLAGCQMLGRIPS